MLFQYLFCFIADQLFVRSHLMQQIFKLLYYSDVIINLHMNSEEQHPFTDHKEAFKKIKKEDRADWLKQMLDTPQGDGKAPLFVKDYSQSGKWIYKENQLHYHYSKQENKKPSAVLFYFHGLNAHGGGSGYFGMSMLELCGVDVYALDFTNFGRSKGPFRGLIESFDEMVIEAEEFMKYILNNYEDKPKVYVSGLSLGGGVCFQLALRKPELITGVIFLSPALRGNPESQPFMKKIGWLMGSVFPRLKIVSQTFSTSNKLDVMDRINSDPYIYKDKVVPGSIKTVLDAMDASEKDWKSFTTPFIMIQSGVDKLVDPFQALDFEASCSSKDKTVIYCKDMWHGVFAEEEFPAVVKILANWLNNRLKN